MAWEVIFHPLAEREMEQVPSAKFRKALMNRFLVTTRLDDPRRDTDVIQMRNDVWPYGKFEGWYRLRVGDHRIVFRLLQRETQEHPFRWIQFDDTVSIYGQKYAHVIRVGQREVVYSPTLKTRVYEQYKYDRDNLDIIVSR